MSPNLCFSYNTGITIKCDARAFDSYADLVHIKVECTGQDQTKNSGTWRPTSVVEWRHRVVGWGKHSNTFGVVTLSRPSYRLSGIVVLIFAQFIIFYILYGVEGC